MSSSTQLQVSNSSVELEESLEGRDEQHQIERFISKCCGRKFGLQCSDFVTKEAIVSSRQACMELTKYELHLVVLSNIQAHQALDGQATLGSSHHEVGGLSDILCYQYYIHGVLIPILYVTFSLRQSCSSFQATWPVYLYTGNFKCTLVNTIPFEEVS